MGYFTLTSRFRSIRQKSASTRFQYAPFPVVCESTQCCSLSCCGSYPLGFAPAPLYPRVSTPLSSRRGIQRIAKLFPLRALGILVRCKLLLLGHHTTDSLARISDIERN